MYRTCQRSFGIVKDAGNHITVGKSEKNEGNSFGNHVDKENGVQIY